MKPKGPKQACRSLGGNPSERAVKDFIVGAIETSLSEKLQQMGFSKREVKELLAGSTNARTERSSPVMKK